jgi:hypothetical protein
MTRNQSTAKGGQKDKAEGSRKELAARELRRQITSTLPEAARRITEMVGAILKPEDVTAAAAALIDIIDIVGSERRASKRTYLSIHASFAALLHMCESREEIIKAVHDLHTLDFKRGSASRKGDGPRRG